MYHTLTYCVIACPTTSPYSLVPILVRFRTLLRSGSGFTMSTKLTKLHEVTTP